MKKEEEFCLEAVNFEFVLSGKSRWEYLIVTDNQQKAILFEFRKKIQAGNDRLIGKN